MADDTEADDTEADSTETQPRAASVPLRIVVVRSGGFAGISRSWRVEAGSDDAVAEWRPFVDACPWDSVGVDPASRDRFTWRIEVRVSRRTHQASVPDRELTGPWRALVDRVQEQGDDG